MHFSPGDPAQREGLKFEHTRPVNCAPVRPSNKPDASGRNVSEIFWHTQFRCPSNSALACSMTWAYASVFETPVEKFDASAWTCDQSAIGLCDGSTFSRRNTDHYCWITSSSSRWVDFWMMLSVSTRDETSFHDASHDRFRFPFVSNPGLAHKLRPQPIWEVPESACPPAGLFFLRKLHYPAGINPRHC